MIRTESLTKFYGSRCAVRDLSVAIEDNEIVGFLGLNGAGKTTALRMLAGLLAPSTGTIEIDGVDMLASSSRHLRWKIGFLPDRPPLYEEMTVRAYLDFATRLRGYDDAHAQRRVEEVIERTGCSDYADEPIANLSHGYRQRVGIAQAIAHDPKLVILDEPTGGLDPVQIVEMRTLIRSLEDRHTVLLSSHNLPEISQSCDRLMVIKDGALVWAGSEADLSSKLRGDDRIELELIGEEGRALQLFERLAKDGVVRDFVHSAASGVHAFMVHLGRGTPEELARAIVAGELGLRRMQPGKSELEDLFLRLTRDEA